ncbi:MAG: hypothetical protein RR229_03400, partial [Oscillospiraceae bacterium]
APSGVIPLIGEMSRSDKRVPVFGEKAKHSQMPEGGSKIDIRKTGQLSVLFSVILRCPTRITNNILANTMAFLKLIDYIMLTACVIEFG